MIDSMHHISTPYVTFEGIQSGVVQYTCRLCRTHFTVPVATPAPVKCACATLNNARVMKNYELDKRLNRKFIDTGEPGPGYVNQD